MGGISTPGILQVYLQPTAFPLDILYQNCKTSNRIAIASVAAGIVLHVAQGKLPSCCVISRVL